MSIFEDRMRDKTRDKKIIKVGDYVPHSLVYPPWGDGTYRVFKLARVVGIMEDKAMDKNEDRDTGAPDFGAYPEGNHDDQVDAVPFPDFKPPIQLRRWFNVLMLIINLFTAILLLLIIPVVIGLTLLDPPVTFWDWLRTYTMGLIGTAGIGVAAVYFGMVFNETRKGIMRNIALIRKNMA